MLRLLIGMALLLVACSKTSTIPECQSADVLNLVRDMVKKQPLARLQDLGAVRIHHPAEIHFEKNPSRRVCRAELETNLGRGGFTYEVSWQDEAKGIMWVEIKE